MKKFLYMLLISIMVISLSACASPTNEEPEEPSTPPVEDKDTNGDNGDEDNLGGEDSEQADTEDEEDKVEDKKEQEVDLYFVNSEYVETGDESLDHLKVEKRMVNYEDMILEEAVVRELLKGPGSGDLTTGMPETIKLLEVKVMDNTAYVDFSSDGLEGASLQETLTIEQIVESLTNLEGVDKVQFLKDGSEADSLMGHVSIDQPFEGK